MTRLADLFRSNYDVFEAYDAQELKNKALAELPDIIVIDTIFAQKDKTIDTLHEEKALEHIFFLLLEEENADDTDPA